MWLAAADSLPVVLDSSSSLALCQFSSNFLIAIASKGQHYTAQLIS